MFFGYSDMQLSSCLCTNALSGIQPIQPIKFLHPYILASLYKPPDKPALSPKDFRLKRQLFSVVLSADIGIKDEQCSDRKLGNYGIQTDRPTNRYEKS